MMGKLYLASLVDPSDRQGISNRALRHHGRNRVFEPMNDSKILILQFQVYILPPLFTLMLIAFVGGVVWYGCARRKQKKRSGMAMASGNQHHRFILE